MRHWLWLTLLALLVVGCKQQTREQIAQRVGQAMLRQAEKNADARIRQFLVKHLENPDTYRPLGTEYGVVMSNNILYDSQTFVAVRDLRKSLDRYRRTFGTDTTSTEALKEQELMYYMLDVLNDRVHAIENRPVEFEAISARHRFNVASKGDKQVECDYHFVIHKD